MPEKISRKLVSPWDFWYCLHSERTFFFLMMISFFITETHRHLHHNQSVRRYVTGKLQRTRAMASLLYFGRRMRAAVVILSLPGYHSKLTGALQYCIIWTFSHYWSIKWRFYFKGLKTVHKHKMLSSHGILWMGGHVCSLNTAGDHIWNIKDLYSKVSREI